jgi:hypothetical protein
VEGRRRAGDAAAAAELRRLQKLRRAAGIPDRLFRPADLP